jgi:type IV pilus assembly protein PilO
MQLGLNKLPWYGQVGIFFGLVVVSAGLFYFFYVIDAETQLAARQKELDGLRAEIAKGRQIARRLPEFEAEVADLETRLESLKAVLPEQKDVAGLLTKIQTLATQSNLVIRGFKPGAVANRDLHAEWPITLELDGSYHDLGAFFDKVSKVPRIINVNNIEIGSVTKPDSPHSIEARCLATTFVLLDNPQPAAKPGAAKPRPNQPAPSGAAAR